MVFEPLAVWVEQLVQNDTVVVVVLVVLLLLDGIVQEAVWWGMEWAGYYVCSMLLVEECNFLPLLFRLVFPLKLMEERVDVAVVCWVV